MRTPGERTSGAWTGGCAIHPDGGDETDRTAGNSYTATPPRKKKQWTEKEEAYLQDKWGTVSIKGLSKALGRSENAIIVRAQRLGCGAHLAGDTRISLNQLMLAIYGKNMLGYTSDRLIRYGLPVKWHVVKKNRFRVIDIDAFWKWAEDNKSILDFSRFEKYGLGAEPDWVDVKRKAD